MLGVKALPSLGDDLDLFGGQVAWQRLDVTVADDGHGFGIQSATFLVFDVCILVELVWLAN